VKLSVKLLSGLTLIALVAVAVVGLSHSASAAADGKVYVTNKASNLTTEGSGKPSGRTTASTVYGTYKSSVTTGTTARDIVTNSDRFIVTVIDSDLNTTTTVTSNNTSGYDADRGTAANDVSQLTGSGFDSTDDSVLITIDDTKTKPIIGSNSDIKVVVHGSSRVVTGVSATIQYAGDGSNAPLIRLDVDYGTHHNNVKYNILYPTSAVDMTTATVKSVVYTGSAAVVTLTETGRNTGRFEGEVLVKERTSGFTTGTNGGSTGSPAQIPAIGGPITVTYVDVATSGTATNVNRTASLALDTTVPTVSITSPTSGSETQNRLPSFSGGLTDNESGLDVSTFALRIDNTTDKANSSMVISAGGSDSAATKIGKVASISTSAWSDGAASQDWSYTETVVLPNSTIATPDHVVDFQGEVADLAGNYGYSDSSSSKGNDGTGRHGNQPHTVKIDRVLPTISAAETGKAWDTTIATPAEKSNVRDSLVVRFDGKVNEASISESDFQVVLSNGAGTFVPASVVVQGADVYLDIDSTIPSNNKPTVKLQGTVEDIAGNSTSAGSAIASDKLAPVITVTRSGGSGTGTGAEASDSLTKSKMTISVSSDENLQAAPTVTVKNITTSATVANAVSAVAQGGNVWELTVTAAADGSHSVSVTATDSASNSATEGKDTVKAYVRDATLSAPTSSPANGSTVTESNPFLVSDYSADASSITITSAEFNGDDVTASLIASADSKTFFYQPTTALENKEHTYKVKSKDAAGNTNTTTTKFTKKDRTNFVLTLFAGWNAVSVPSNPVDSDVNSVLSNSGVQQVVAYDATTPSQPWRIASKVDDSFTSQTTPGLTTIEAGHGYWVEASDFEDQKVALEGPTGPGDSRPAVTAIATGSGWNFVGVIDQSRIQTQSGSKGATLTRPNEAGSGVNVTHDSYFKTVNNGRTYAFDTVTSQFNELEGSDVVKIGLGLWVFISPQDNGQLPHLVP
tara:strand:- start:14596 stop:17508 length:2913 start_codon:yes stop_codon:yes gene_type:complete